MPSWDVRIPLSRSATGYFSYEPLVGELKDGVGLRSGYSEPRILVTEIDMKIPSKLRAVKDMSTFTH